MKITEEIEQYQKLMTEDTAERMRLRRRGENLEVYKMERSFDTTEKVAENIGGGLGGDGGNLIGTMVSLGMVNPIANQMGGLMQNNTQVTNTENISSNNDKIFDDLKKLGELKSSGVLTEEEFNEKKIELLSKIK